MKTCSKCKELKEFSEFYKANYTSSGYSCSCKACHKITYSKYKKLNRKKLSEKQKEYNAKNKERNRLYHLNNKEKLADKKKWSHLKKTFNLDKEQYLKMLKIQNNVCYICKNIETTKGAKYLSVDHCHKTGKIRGLLCAACNKALGGFKDNIEYLESAIKYLKENQINETTIN